MNRTHGSKDFWLAAMRAEATSFRAAVGAEGALGVETPSCPGWTVGALTRHLGAVYQWVRGHVSRGTTDRPERLTTPDGAPEPTDPAVVAWFDEQRAQLDALLDTLDPDLPAWNWAPQSKTAGFWHRRMAHETAVHRWDAQLAIGLAEPIEAKLAGDTIAEVLDSWLPAGRRRGATDRSGMVRLTATDLSHEWYVRLRGEGVALLDTDTLFDDDEHPARAAAGGSASDLALALWGRVAFNVVETSGDPGLLDALRVG